MSATEYAGEWTWAVVEDDDGWVVGHVYPTDDIIEHQVDGTGECSCHTELEGLDSGTMLDWFERLADGRTWFAVRHRPAPAGFRGAGS
jgi:hypothetical protein